VRRPSTPAPPPRLVRSDVDELTAELCELAGHVHAATAELVRLLGRLDAIGGLAGAGIRSLGHWASIYLGIDLRTAAQQGKVGRQLETLPAIAAAARAGELGWSKLRLLAQVAEPATEPKWLDLAREMSVGPLARVVSAYRRASDADDPDRFENQRQRRGIWLFDEPDGLVRVTGLLEPDDAAMLRAALAAQGEGCGATTARTPTSPINPASATRPTPTLTPAAPATPTSPARTANPMSWPATLLWGSRRGPRKWTRRWRRGIRRRPSGSMRGWRWRGRAGRRRGARRRRAQRLVNRAQRRALRFRDGPGCAFLGCVLSKPTELPPGRRLRPVGRENRGATARAGRVRRHRRRGWRVRDPIQCTEAHWGHSLTPVDGPPRLVPRVTGRAPPPGPRRA
jgi:hypothetical protein